MGIGNTTAASAMVAALTGAAVEDVTGPGTGVDEAGRRRKVAAISRALEVNRPDAGDPLDVLAKVGGLEIAGLVGVTLAAAAHQVPVVLDGFISGAAALVAVRLKPEVRALSASPRTAPPSPAIATCSRRSSSSRTSTSGCVWVRGPARRSASVSPGPRWPSSPRWRRSRPLGCPERAPAVEGGGG